MPEGFLTDQEVPVRWRILAILNGFHINGKDLYASNDWIARQLDCSERSITNGVKQLEERGEIYCERTKVSRIIKRTLVSDKGSNQLLSPSQTAATQDSKRLLPISDSNADNITSEDKLRIIVSSYKEEIQEDRQKKPPKYPHAKSVFSWFPRPEKSWQLNTTELKHAELLWERGEDRVKKALSYVQEHKEDEMFYKITKPSDLERKWIDLVEYAGKN